MNLIKDQQVQILYLAVNPGITLYLCSQARLIQSDVDLRIFTEKRQGKVCFYIY